MSTDSILYFNGKKILPYAVCGLMLLLIAVVDAFIPLGIAIGVLYSVVVLATYWFKSVRVTIVISTVSCFLIMVICIYKPSTVDMDKVVANRFLSLITTTIIAVLTIKIVRANQLIYQLANYDALTGLLNHREGFNRLEEQFSRVKRNNGVLSVIILDVDHFKQINDSYGHTVGDVVLRQVAQVLKSGVRDYDILCRYGGEEFFIITPDTTIDHAYELSNRLVDLVAAAHINTEAGDVTVTVSAGVTQLLGDDSIGSMVTRADKGLYLSKENGRNRTTMLPI